MGDDAPAAGGFSPSWWLPGPHFQTIWPRLSRRRGGVPYRREVLITPDDDDLILDHLDGQEGSPRLILLHGLEGSSYSVYIGAMAMLWRAGGGNVTAVNFRSCARDPRRLGAMIMNRAPRFYHSGETGDLDLVIRTLAARDPEEALVALGGSLGGNVLLKWMGEHPGDGRLRAACTISVPYDLAAGASVLEKGVGRLYTASFLRTLRRKVVALLARFPEAARRMDVKRAVSARTFRDFDDSATGPLHGFSGADDYYGRSSSIGFVGRITVPTLCLSAEDDPFLPAFVLDRVEAAASDQVVLRRVANGGHVGFVTGRTPWTSAYWAEKTALEWLSSLGSGRKLKELP